MWEEVSIAETSIELIDGDRGKNYPKKTEFTTSGHCIFLNTGNIKDDRLELSHCDYINEERDSLLRKGKLQKNDIIVTTRGTVGAVAYYSDNVPYEHIRINSGMLIVRAGTDFNIRFLYSLLKSDILKKRYKNISSGAAQPQLPIKDFRTIKLPFPPLPIQDKIASIISSYDALIENNLRRIELLEQSARELYKEWFVRFKFPGHEKVQIVDGLPEGWKKKKLGKLLTLQRGFDLPKAAREIGEIPIYASTGITGYHSTTKVHGPGIVTGRSGSLGKVVYSPTDFWPLNTTLWIKKFILVTPLYAKYLLEELRLEQYNGGAAVPTLNRNIVHDIDVYHPPRKIIDDFTAFISDLYQSIENLKKQNSHLKQARDLLLPKLIKGEIEV